MASVFTLLLLSLLPVALSFSHSTAPAPPPAPSSPPTRPPTPPPSSPPRNPPTPPPSSPPRKPLPSPPSSPPRKPLTSPPPSPPRKLLTSPPPSPPRKLLTSPPPSPPRRPPNPPPSSPPRRPPNPPPSSPPRRTPSTPPPVSPPQHRLYIPPASKPQPPPTPPASASAPEDHTQMDNIADALIGSGDFGNWIDLLMSAGNSSSLPVALPQPKNPDPFPNQVDFDPFLFAYHVVPQRLSFADLRARAVGSRLPTLLPGNSLLITNNSFSNFTINNSPITHPDLYLNGAVSVQGVGESFDYKRFGTEDSKPRPAQPPPRFIRAPPHRSRGINPGFTFLPGQIGGGTRKSGTNFFFGYWIPLVFGFGIMINTPLASIRFSGEELNAEEIAEL